MLSFTATCGYAAETEFKSPWSDKVFVSTTDTGNPLDSVDSDNDGLADSLEIAYGSNPYAADTDGDGVNDGDEITLGLNPLSQMTDGVTPDADTTY